MQGRQRVCTGDVSIHSHPCLRIAYRVVPALVHCPHIDCAWLCLLLLLLMLLAAGCQPPEPLAAGQGLHTLG